jgi:hypothetical protein
LAALRYLSLAARHRELHAAIADALLNLSRQLFGIAGNLI